MKITQNLYNSLHEVGLSIYNGCVFKNFNLQTNNPILNVIEFNITELNVDHNMDWELNDFRVNDLPPNYKTVFYNIIDLGVDIVDIIMQYYNADIILDYLLEKHDKVILETMQEFLPNMVKDYNLEKIPFAQWPLWMQDFISDGFLNRDYNLGYKDRMKHGGYSSMDWEEETKKDDDGIIILNGVRYKKLD